jgi:hypothetical protein
VGPDATDAIGLPTGPALGPTGSPSSRQAGMAKTTRATRTKEEVTRENERPPGSINPPWVRSAARLA